MKNYQLILIIFLVLTSCGKVTCLHTPFSGVRISNYDSTLDSAVKVISYVSGTNFQQPVDSSSIKLAGKGFEYTFKDGKDYSVTFYPGGTRYTIRDIKYGNEKGSGSPGKSSDMCSNSISYRQDDSLISLPFINSDGNEREEWITLYN